jgi:hypothetical protein
MHTADNVRFPRCAECNEDLRQCASCRHYEAMACHDPVGARLFSLDTNAAMDCPSFASNYAVSGWLRSLPAPGWVALSLLLLLVCVTAFIYFIEPDMQLVAGNEKLHMMVSVESLATVGRQCRMNILMRNEGRRASSRYFIVLDGSLLSVVDTNMPLPVPKSITQDEISNRLVMEYKPIAPHGWTVVRLYFTPRRQPGDYRLHVSLYSPNYKCYQEANAPVKVVNASPAPAHGRTERNPL